MLNVIPDVAGFDSDVRDLLRRALTLGREAISAAMTTKRTIHGSPHRNNILNVQGAPRFIDFETIQHGPIEWDLAHLEPEVAHHYQDPIDHQLLEWCRLVVSAKTSTLCWQGINRGPDMRGHAEHHLQIVRSRLAALDHDL